MIQSHPDGLSDIAYRMGVVPSSVERDQASTLSINVLGGLDIWVGGRPAKIPTMGRVLLGYLACMNGRDVSREIIADLLWPETSSDQARHRLRNCLVEVRRALGNDRLVSENAGPNVGDCRLVGEISDIGRLKELAAGEFTSPEILDLYRGPLLAGIDIGSESFRDWLATERRHVEQMMLGVLSGLARRESEAGNHQTAIRAADLAVEIDELNEESHQQKIIVLKKADRRADAVRFYHGVRDTLRRELGVEPSETTVGLLRDARATMGLGNEIERLRSALSASERREQELAALLQEMIAVRTAPAFAALRSRARQALVIRGQKPAEAA